jgi:hypothetical protein
MSLSNELHRIDFERAKADPSGVFTSPTAVLADERFSGVEKLEILREWVHDADLLEIAESEGMGGGEPSMLGRVLAALHEMQSLTGHGGQAATDSHEPRDGVSRDG